jgi:hypothetical protein
MVLRAHQFSWVTSIDDDVICVGFPEASSLVRFRSVRTKQAAMRQVKECLEWQPGL